MTIELNHTIVPAREPKASAQFLADILGLPVDPPVARFTRRSRVFLPGWPSLVLDAESCHSQIVFEPPAAGDCYP
jgi:hypothetical protein